jgi:pimeloyl-ACP methyl ester carboxylesterase
MRVLVASLIAALCLMLAPAAAAKSSPSAAGEWVGGFEIDHRWIFCRLVLPDADSAPATLDIPTEGILARPLDGLHTGPARAAFRAATPSGELAFQGQLRGNTLAGAVNRDGRGGRFELWRAFPMEPWLFGAYVGSYALEEDSSMMVFQMGNHLCAMTSRRIVPIYPLDETTYFAEDGSRIAFNRDKEGTVTGLTWQPRHSETRAASRVRPYEERELVFRNSPVRLSGTLFLPPGEGPFPAVVLVHGSGRQDRSTLRMFADRFARAGIAALAYDKRGVGASTGDYARASLADLAGDALSAWDSLRDIPEVDAGAIGLWGISQGGWVSVLAAAKAPEIAWVILVSGPGVSPATQQTYRLDQEMRDAGISDHGRREVLAAWEALFTWLRSGRGQEPLAAMVDRLGADEAMRAWLPPPPGAVPPEAWFLHLGIDFDPSPVLATLRCPVLAIYGELDRLVPVNVSTNRIQAALRRGHNPDFNIHIFPRANHNLMSGTRGSRSELLTAREFAPGFFETMIDWLRARFPATAP